MRQPGRVRIGWQDTFTLRVETDAGRQTGLLVFGGPARSAVRPSLQGSSTAVWQYANGFDPARHLPRQWGGTLEGRDGEPPSRINFVDNGCARLYTSTAPPVWGRDLFAPVKGAGKRSRQWERT
jgi:hypothetical protein